MKTEGLSNTAATMPHSAKELDSGTLDEQEELDLGTLHEQKVLDSGCIRSSYNCNLMDWARE
jgi:hypothetical protein